MAKPFERFSISKYPEDNGLLRDAVRDVVIHKHNVHNLVLLTNIVLHSLIHVPTTFNGDYNRTVLFFIFNSEMERLNNT